MDESLMRVFETAAESLLVRFLVVVAGVVFAQFVQTRWERWRYGGWVVTVKGSQMQEPLSRPISPRKAKEILEEPADLSVFLKGVASPYAWIRCDLVGKGREIGLLQEDRAARRFVIDLDRNPASKAAGPP
jgi:hypothetical protein